VSTPDEELSWPRRRLRRPWLTATTAAVAVLLGVAIALQHTGGGRSRPHPPASAPPGEILAAGPCGQQLTRMPGEGAGPLDGGLLISRAQIAPVNRPRFEPVAAARRWLPAEAPVVVVQVGGVARAYPLAVLELHEVVNDTVGGRPLAITYCPLCNTAAVYSRLVRGTPVMLQPSGALLNGAAVLVAAGTGQMWSQASGVALRAVRTPLAWWPSDTVSLAEAAAAYPGVRVLARPADGLDYRRSPYGGVAAAGSLPALYLGWVDEHLDPKARVVGVAVGPTATAWRYAALSAVGVRDDTVAGVAVVVVYRPRVTGIGDSSDLARAPAVGAAAVYAARAAGRTLHFVRAGPSMMRDVQTGSSWDLTGRAVAGPLAGTRLRPLRFLNTYWFAWVAFHPTTAVRPRLRATQCAIPRR
jgi:hypothetical protein